MRTRTIAAALLLAAPLLSGCTTSSTCVSWVAYDSAEQMQQDAGLVVDAGSVEPAGTESWNGVPANLYDVVAAPIGPDGGAQEMAMHLRVLSTPETCSAETYPEGDPMLGAQGARLFLVEDGDGRWRTLTPFQGVGAP